MPFSYCSHAENFFITSSVVYSKSYVDLNQLSFALVQESSKIPSGETVNATWTIRVNL